jgi:chemotaxis signal transduction protein
MKYFLFEIDGINYGLPVDAVERIEDIPAGKNPRTAVWQKGLLRTGKREKGHRYSKAISVSSEEDTKTTRILLDRIIDIREVYEEEPSPFPVDSTETPEELFEGVLMLGDEPYLVLDAANISRYTNKDG